MWLEDRQSIEQGSLPLLERDDASSSDVHLTCEDSIALSDEGDDACSGASEASALV